MQHIGKIGRVSACGLLLLLLGISRASEPVLPEDALSVDFRYAPAWWQSLVCLPDDPDKPLVGREGQLLFDFGRGGPRGFTFSIAPQIEGGSRWLRQDTATPRAPLVQTWKDADGVEVLECVFVAVPETVPNLQVERAAGIQGTREHVVLIRFKNLRAEAVERRPMLRIEGVAPVSFDPKEGLITIGKDTVLLASDGIEFIKPDGRAWIAGLPAMRLDPGEEGLVALTIMRRGERPFYAHTVSEAQGLRGQALAWWEAADLPFGKIEVPDPGVQGILDACVRNIWQAREVVGGRPAFHVGPTHYRSLWVADSAFVLETVAMLGRTRDARAGIEHLMGFQAPHGGFELKPKYWKEDGLMLWTVVRHAQLTRDREWLRRQWHRVERVVDHIRELRREAAGNPDAPHFGLLPPGDVDGGIGLTGDSEYSNSYWCLIGMKSAIEAARWLGFGVQVAEWEEEFEKFSKAFRRAAERDLRPDFNGNRYLPIMMADAGGELPQRGQWAFCHAVYPGELFSAGDPIAGGNMAMLRATLRQGMVFGTGWDPEGIWTYFASFYGHALLWTGRGGEAAQALHDFANHAAPTRVWWEEQLPVGREGLEVGDMPHNWASAEFIRLTAHLLAIERGNEMHLFEGLPARWVRPGMTTRLNGILTRLGPLDLELRVADDGKSARLRVGAMPSAGKIVIHLGGWASERADATLEFGAERPVEVEMPLSRGPG